jgi:hypothetical protein
MRDGCTASRKREGETKMANATAKKATFELNGTDYEAYSNGKEYGANRTCYIEVTRDGASKAGYRGACSIGASDVSQFKAGEREVIRAAAHALGFIG